MIEIKQIVLDSWVGADGKTRNDVLGLGDDSNIYKWHRGTGKWILFVMTQ